MKWSVKLGTYAGIGVYMHLTFLLLLAWVAAMHWVQQRDVAGTLAGVAFVLAIFGCVLLHEFGHALTARGYGIRTRDITLLPIGGLARLERMPDDPRQELWVALAGPAVNLVIAAALSIVLVVGDGLALNGLSLTEGSFLVRLLLVNVILVAFNMLPAFPMDGGRVLRALLATRIDYVRATQLAAGIGQGMALMFGLIGLFYNPLLLFVALFVWIGADQESGMVRVRSVLGGIPVRQAMLTDFRTVRPDSPLSEAVELTLAGSQKDFPVTEGDRVVGVLCQGDLFARLARSGLEGRVDEIMVTEFQVAHPHELLERTFERLSQCACRTAPVVQDGRLVGILTMDNVGELLAIQGALRRTHETQPA